MKKIIVAVIFVGLVGVGLAWGMGILKSEAVPQQEPSILDVKSSMTRYGRQESAVMVLTNNSDSEIVFPNRQYGVKIYQRQGNGMWKEVINPANVNSRIHTLQPGEEIEVDINHEYLEVGHYRLVFEGWLMEDYTKHVKGETRFQLLAYPTFQIDILSNQLRVNDYLDISVTNDRLESINFADSTLSLELFILNESDNWMKLPSPLHNDQEPFELKSGQKHQLRLPPFRAGGQYKLIFKGEEKESGLEVRGEVILDITR